MTRTAPGVCAAGARAASAVSGVIAILGIAATEGCRLVADPPAATWRCSTDAPACPGDEVCLVADGDDDGTCGASGGCFGAADASGVARPVVDCTPCEGPGDGGGYACEAGACVAVSCGSACLEVSCGDGCVSGDERCDDGGRVAGDGCSPSCVDEPGWTCAGVPSSCSASECGDELTAGDEGCDDGNANPADRCAQCRAVVWQLADGTASLAPVRTDATLEVRADDHCVRVTVGSATQTLGVCGEAGSLGGLLFEPLAAAFNADASVVYVADSGNHRVLRFAVDAADDERADGEPADGEPADGEPAALVIGTGEASSIGTGKPARALPVERPDGVAVDGHGNLFITSGGRLRQVANVDGLDDADGGDEVIDIDTCGDSARGVAVDGDALVVVLQEGPRRCERRQAP